MRVGVEADLQGLSKVFDDLTLRKTDLEIQIEELNKDLAILQKEHQEVRVAEMFRECRGSSNSKIIKMRGEETGRRGDGGGAGVDRENVIVPASLLHEVALPKNLKGVSQTPGSLLPVSSHHNSCPVKEVTRFIIFFSCQSDLRVFFRLNTIGILLPQEVDALRRQLGTNVNVEVDAAPGLNLGEIMNEMRQKYEVLAQKNLQEAKEQFEKQVIPSVSRCEH